MCLLSFRPHVMTTSLWVLKELVLCVRLINVEKPVCRPEPMASPRTRLITTELNRAESSKTECRFWELGSGAVEHHFPIPRLFHVDFALQPHSWGKTDASSAAALLLLLPLLILCRLSSPSPPFAPWAFFYGRASNTWPLPCIRLHVHVHTQQNKQEQCVIK